MKAKILSLALCVIMALGAIVPASAAAPVYADDVALEVIVAPQYEEVGDMNDGYAPVKVNGKWGYINERGEMVVAAKYDTATEYDGAALVSRDGKFYAVKMDGTEVALVTEAMPGDYTRTHGTIADSVRDGYVFNNGDVFNAATGREILPAASDRALIYSVDGWNQKSAACDTYYVKRYFGDGVFLLEGELMAGNSYSSASVFFTMDANGKVLRVFNRDYKDENGDSVTGDGPINDVFALAQGKYLLVSSGYFNNYYILNSDDSVVWLYAVHGIMHYEDNAYWNDMIVVNKRVFDGVYMYDTVNEWLAEFTIFRYGTVDLNGNEVIPAKYKGMDVLTSSIFLAEAELPGQENIDYNPNDTSRKTEMGYFDKSGKQYDVAGLDGGVANLEERHGFNEEGIAIVKDTAGRSYVISNKAKNGVLPIVKGSDQYTPVSRNDGYVIIEKSGKYGFAKLTDGASTPDVPAIAPGTPIGDVEYTKIVAYIDGKPIRSYNINGNTHIVVEDLAQFGFDVQWIAEGSGRLVVPGTRTATPDAYTTTYTPDPNAPTEGVAMQYLATNVTAWLGDKQVTGYNIGGMTCIWLDELHNVFGYGLTWDGVEGALRLTTQP